METFEITSYERLANRLGKKEAASLIGFLKHRARAEVNRRMDTFLVKQDKVELIEKISDTRNELIEKISGTRSELIEKIAESQHVLIRWMVILWLSAVALIVGILKFL